MINSLRRCSAFGIYRSLLCLLEMEIRVTVRSSQGILLTTAGMIPHEIRKNDLFLRIYLSYMLNHKNLSIRFS